jgi:hypothetical protein
MYVLKKRKKRERERDKLQVWGEALIRIQSGGAGEH